MHSFVQVPKFQQEKAESLLILCAQQQGPLLKSEAYDLWKIQAETESARQESKEDCDLIFLCQQRSAMAHTSVWQRRWLYQTPAGEQQCESQTPEVMMWTKHLPSSFGQHQYLLP